MVGTGDLDGDGRDELLTGPGPNGSFGTSVRIWRYDPGSVSLLGGFEAYSDYGLTYGVLVAAGDVDGDGEDEIITGPGPNPSYGSLVRVWDRVPSTWTYGLTAAFYGYDDLGLGAGVVARAGDLDVDGVAEIVTGPGASASNPALVRVFKRQPGGSYSKIFEWNLIGTGGAQAAVVRLVPPSVGVAPEPWNPAGHEIASGIRLERVWPNPLRGRDRVRIEFSAPQVPGAADPVLTILDVSGRVVARPEIVRVAAGRFAARWDGTRASGAKAAPGVYIARAAAGGRSGCAKLVVLDR
ncbi:MAG: hypothetical protein A2V63_12660 [Candidatus Eisenbacteria bacterium RBG_19FT_COMBO_70_11]|nr:MAG: hypothetical protein A2V63_12660 [Candidatus Eisenbacteria bacterium RBG_19FT_COMBO_70_11]